MMTENAARWFANFRQTHALPDRVGPIIEWFENVMQQAYDAGRAAELGPPSGPHCFINAKDLVAMHKGQFHSCLVYVHPLPTHSLPLYTAPPIETVTNTQDGILPSGAKLHSGHQVPVPIPESDAWQLVPKEITKEMAQKLESNIADCVPPSEVHRANWAEAWRNALAVAPKVTE